MTRGSRDDFWRRGGCSFVVVAIVALSLLLPGGGGRGGMVTKENNRESRPAPTTFPHGFGRRRVMSPSMSFVASRLVILDRVLARLL